MKMQILQKLTKSKFIIKSPKKKKKSNPFRKCFHELILKKLKVMQIHPPMLVRT